MDDQETYEALSPLIDLPECRSNELREKHMEQKWSRLLSPAAYRAWRAFVDNENTNSVTYFYFALETGKFWFPAQVYYTEKWDVSYVLSCYDAELSYDATSDSFHARYPPHGKRGVEIEKGIEWERVRAKPVDISPYQLYIPNCVNDLHPGDHVEAQWRRNKVSPFGWWYGVVGHLEACKANDSHCQCHDNGNVVLEFKQYAVGSRWRRTSVARKGGEEEGNKVVGFYGGIRKLNTNQEIALWERFRPPHIME